MDFYTIVSIVAILLLIISLVTVSVIIMQSNSTATFPSFQNSCPDYWKYNSATNTCSVNGLNTGSLVTPTPIPVSSSANLCANFNWANKNSILWDGVSNINSCKLT